MHRKNCWKKILYLPNRKIALKKTTQIYKLMLKCI